MTDNVHRTWAAFFVDILCCHIFCPQKPHNTTLFYRGTCIEGRRHLVTAAPFFFCFPFLIHFKTLRLLRLYSQAHTDRCMSQ